MPPPPSPQPEAIRQAVIIAGLTRPDMPKAERTAAVKDIAARYGITERTVYRHINAALKRRPVKAPRRDRGTCRALTPEQHKALASLLLHPGWAAASVRQLHRHMQAVFPDANISYDTVARQRENIVATIPRDVSVPRKIDVPTLNARWEIDLSKGDLFLADPNHNGGYPFRPQLIVCEDAATRSCMYAMYTPTGKRYDIGVVMHNAIIPQSRAWPQCGLPKEVGCDWGKVFVGEFFETACSSLGIRVNKGHPYYPQDKGKVERLIGTIHNSCENVLVGFTTNDNTGDDAIDPRKFFKPVMAARGGVEVPVAWIDPRFDRPLMTLAEANQVLWSWISCVYHDRVHSAIKPHSPTSKWLLATRGVSPDIPQRDFLDELWLPFVRRKVRRGQVVVGGIVYFDECLASYEDLEVIVRYTPETVKSVAIYVDHLRICDAAPAPRFCIGEDMDWGAWHRIKRANAQAAATRKAVMQELAEADIVPRPSAAEVFTEQAEQADIPFVLPPTERRIDPLVAGLTDEEIAELEDVEVWGMPLLPGGRRAAEPDDAEPEAAAGYRW